MDDYILLVEDNPDDVFLTRRAFKKCNIQVRLEVARDGVEALDFLRNSMANANGEPWNLPVMILLDLKLPKMDGHDVLMALRDDPRTQIIPVVVLTTSEQKSDIRRCYQLGANSFIRKPIDLIRFQAVVEQLGLYWLALNERAG